jgi:hypothetical protein
MTPLTARKICMAFDIIYHAARVIFLRQILVDYDFFKAFLYAGPVCVCVCFFFLQNGFEQNALAYICKLHHSKYPTDAPQVCARRTNEEKLLK